MSLFHYERQRMYGMVLAVVSDNQDPEGMGRVRVTFHMLDEQVQSDWCRVVSLYAGVSRGMEFLPEEGDEVVIAFEHGDVNFPLVLGSVHHGKAKPPQPQNKENDLKIIKTRSGHTLTFDDKKGAERIQLIDSSGKNIIEIDVKNHKITIESQSGDLFLSAPKGKLDLNCKVLNISASDSATLTTDGTLKVTAKQSATVELKADLSIKAAQDIKVESQGKGIAFKAATALQAQSAQLEIKSSGPGKLEASANLVIKGAKVMIN